MVRNLLALSLLCCALPARAQPSRSPVVHVEVVRGPIGVRELRDAWTGRSLRRCRDQGPDTIVDLQARIDLDGSVRVDEEPGGDGVSPQRGCVIEVLTHARFAGQTEPTHVRVTIDFSPGEYRPRSAVVSARWRGSRPLAARLRR